MIKGSLAKTSTTDNRQCILPFTTLRSLKFQIQYISIPTKNLEQRGVSAGLIICYTVESQLYPREINASN